MADAAADRPVGAEAFAAAMERLGGFEPRPAVAVGVSGGADSLALVLLLRDWAAARGGSVLALTIDHRLRPESGAEAEQVAAWMAQRGVAHAVIPWIGEKPASGIQDGAREARRRLLAERCRDEGLLHLALAHHRDDQAETVLLRLARGSGPDGLAGMPAIRYEGAVRVIRPLLALPHSRLVATCLAAGQPWLEDPSNLNPAFARGRLRGAASVLAGEGLTAERVVDTAARCASLRSHLDEGTALLLAEAVALRPEGWALVDEAILRAAPAELGRRALGRLLTTVGGGSRVPRSQAVDRLYGVLFDAEGGWDGGGRTLGGCVVLRRRGALVIAREPAAAVDCPAVAPGREVLWDGRFTVSLAADVPAGLSVARLGDEGWREIAAARPQTALSDLPVPVREALPACRVDGRLVGAPVTTPFGGLEGIVGRVRFTPRVPLAGPAFPVVSPGGSII